MDTVSLTSRVKDNNNSIADFTVTLDYHVCVFQENVYIYIFFFLVKKSYTIMQFVATMVDK